MLRIVYAVVIYFSLAIYSYASEEVQPALSFRQFTQKVIAHYPQLKAAHIDVDIALARQMQANAGFWPSLNLSMGYMVSEDPVNVFGMLLRQERFTSSDFDLKNLNNPDDHQNISSGVHLEIPLFDSMQAIYQTRAARERLKASQSEESFTKMEAILLAQDAYLNALTLKELSKIVNQVQEDSTLDLGKARDLKDKGMILGADYFAARVTYGEFSRIKNELDREMLGMLTLLNILMGEPVDRKWTLEDVAKSAEIEGDLQSLISSAYSTRADLKALDLQIKALDAQVSGAKATALPNISAFAEGTNDRNKISASGGNNYTAGIKASLPLFDPERSGRIKEANAQKERVLSSLQGLKDQIARDLVQEFSKYQALKENLEVLKSMTDDAGQGVSLMVPLYNEGRKSIADLMEMRRAYLQTMEGYIKATNGLEMSRGRLLFLTGHLNEDVGQ